MLQLRNSLWTRVVDLGTSIPPHHLDNPKFRLCTLSNMLVGMGVQALCRLRTGPTSSRNQLTPPCPYHTPTSTLLSASLCSGTLRSTPARALAPLCSYNATNRAHHSTLHRIELRYKAAYTHHRRRHRHHQWFFFFFFLIREIDIVSHRP